MSDDNVKPETDKKTDERNELPEEALDKATGGIVLDEEKLAREKILQTDETKLAPLEKY